MLQGLSSSSLLGLVTERARDETKQVTFFGGTRESARDEICREGGREGMIKGYQAGYSSFHTTKKQVPCRHSFGSSRNLSSPADVRWGGKIA